MQHQQTIIDYVEYAQLTLDINMNDESLAALLPFVMNPEDRTLYSWDELVLRLYLTDEREKICKDLFPSLDAKEVITAIMIAIEFERAMQKGYEQVNGSDQLKMQSILMISKMAPKELELMFFSFDAWLSDGSILFSQHLWMALDAEELRPLIPEYPEEKKLHQIPYSVPADFDGVYRRGRNAMDYCYIKPKLDPEAKNGQYKLFSDLQRFMEDCYTEIDTLLYVGAFPGNNVKPIATAFPNIKFVLFDIRHSKQWSGTFPENVEWVDRIQPKKYGRIALYSDVCSKKGVEYDYQISIIQRVQPVVASLKVWFQFSGGTHRKVVGSNLYAQVFLSSGGGELRERLWYDGNLEIEEIPAPELERWISRYNRVTRKGRLAVKFPVTNCSCHDCSVLHYSYLSLYDQAQQAGVENQFVQSFGEFVNADKAEAYVKSSIREKDAFGQKVSTEIDRDSQIYSYSGSLVMIHDCQGNQSKVYCPPFRTVYNSGELIEVHFRVNGNSAKISRNNYYYIGPDSSYQVPPGLAAYCKSKKLLPCGVRFDRRYELCKTVEEVLV